MIVDVALPIPVTKTFSYAVPKIWEPFVKPFQRVRVPFHNRTQTGVITAVAAHGEDKLKEIVEPVDFFPLVDSALIDLILWASQHYVAPPGLALKYALPSTLNLEPYLRIRSENKSAAALDGLTLKRAFGLRGREKIFRHFADGDIAIIDAITEEPFTSIGREREIGKDHHGALFVGSVEDRIDYYTEIIGPELKKGANVLMLLPDYYASGSYFRKSMTKKFGENVLWYGSNVSARSRMEAFFKARKTGGSLILGNKSAIFLPMSGLSLIVVERHEEDEYRNEEGFKFNAVFIAIERAKAAGIPVVLGSAAPSMEVYHHAREEGGCSIITKNWLLDSSLQQKITVPDIASSAAFVEETLSLVKEGLDRRERTAIFLPRKDYGGYLLCHSCKKPLQCPECEGVLDYQKTPPLLVCPHCSGVFPYEERCGICGSGVIRFLRIGAAYMEEKLREALPDADIARITSDSLREELKKIGKTPSETPLVLVGTQSLSKLYGFHVDRLILCGWEEMRKMNGYRADEKMVQTFINLIDALTPDNIYLLMERKRKVDVAGLSDMALFYEEGLVKRKQAEFPPYGRSFVIDVRHRDKAAGQKNVAEIKEIFRIDGLEETISGMLRSKRNNEYRWRIIVKGTAPSLMKTLMKTMEIRGVQVEPDPLNI